MLTSLKKRIFQKISQKASQKQLSDNSNQILNNLNNREKFVSKKFLTEIDFELRDNLIYYSEKENRLRLCISRTIEKKIFKTVYDDNYYFGYYRCVNRINKMLFIFRALSKICIYVEYCSVCQIN